MSKTNAAKLDPQERRWGRIGIAAVAAAKCVKPREDKPSRRDATLTKLLDSVSEIIRTGRAVRLSCPHRLFWGGRGSARVDDRTLDFGAGVIDLVDKVAHGNGLEVSRPRRASEGRRSSRGSCVLQSSQRSRSCGLDHDRHAVVDRANEALEPVVRIAPESISLPSAECQVSISPPKVTTPPSAGTDPVGLLLRRRIGGTLPFVEARCRAPVRGDAAWHCGRQVFAAAVSHRALRSSGKLTRLLYPGRNQPPADQNADAVSGRAVHRDENRLRRRDVVARRKTLEFVEPERFRHFLRACRQ